MWGDGREVGGGIEHFLSKPFGVSELLGAINKALSS